jgi:predicted nucleotide-binding protein
VELGDAPEDSVVQALAAVEAGEKQIFVVHGHDEANKHELSAFLRDLIGRDPVILHQQPNRGQVLIEKFEANASEAGFAVVILSADDEGKSVASTDPLARRARQNVVFEMGFFFGALGRRNVAVLYEEGVELPSDVTGIAYISLDRAGAWKSLVAREVKDAGIDVNLSALLK